MSKTLIVMAVYNTDENQRYTMTQDSIQSVLNTAPGHDLLVVNNGSTCQKTNDYLEFFGGKFFRLYNSPKNLGTAGAINIGIAQRKGKHVLKIDNDVIVNTPGWADDMELAAERIKDAGIIGAKRKDLIQRPDHPDPNWRSTLEFVPQVPGERWMAAEFTEDIMGTCVMMTSQLLDKIGYMYQFGLYGFDDGIMNVRSLVAGFRNCFLTHINIDHIDPGNTPYQTWKQEYSGKFVPAFHQLKADLYNGKVSYYVGDDFHLRAQ